MAGGIKLRMARFQSRRWVLWAGVEVELASGELGILKVKNSGARFGGLSLELRPDRPERLGFERPGPALRSGPGCSVTGFQPSVCCVPVKHEIIRSSLRDFVMVGAGFPGLKPRATIESSLRDLGASSQGGRNHCRQSGAFAPG